jgi:hypothetical protein
VRPAGGYKSWRSDDDVTRQTASRSRCDICSSPRALRSSLHRRLTRWPASGSNGWCSRGSTRPAGCRFPSTPSLVRRRRAVMAAAAPPYWQVQRLLEGEMVGHRRPMLVRNALDNPRVHLDIQAVMHSHSYVASPVVQRGQVVAFVRRPECGVQRGRRGRRRPRPPIRRGAESRTRPSRDVRGAH